ncbi:MAG: polysaccharide deacetylase family protein [candidate division Zixibacteria bacterium]|nr:polysaccharide deacetylase family protein [candidate division Zixibacteria bacterium]
MKNLLKWTAKRIIYFLGIINFVYWIKLLLSKKKTIVVFTYHRIVDQNSDSSHLLNYDRGIDLKTFKLQIESIKKHFEVVDLDCFLSITTGRTSPNNHIALITFDDADLTFLNYAFPILKELNCPSVVFTPTAYIGTERRFWHLRISNIFENVTSQMWYQIQSISNKFPSPIKAIINSSDIKEMNQKMIICQSLVNELDKYDQKEIDEVIRELENIAGNNYTLDIRCMNWEEHKELVENNVFFQSHTVSHRKLAELSTDEIQKELIDSKTELENRLGKEVISICYPAGSFNNKAIDLLPESGYKLGFTTKQGLCHYPLANDQFYKIPRISIYGKTKIDIASYLLKIALRKSISH